MLREAHEGGMGACLYHSPDHEGSTDVITDSSGNIVWDGDYEAFGSVARSNGTIGFTPSYTGKEFDTDTGLYYFNARWYDPTLGRFITEDPARSGGNWFAYCSNNPLTHTDPTGLAEKPKSTAQDIADAAVSRDTANWLQNSLVSGSSKNPTGAAPVKASSSGPSFSAPSTIPSPKATGSTLLIDEPGLSGPSIFGQYTVGRTQLGNNIGGGNLNSIASFTLGKLEQTTPIGFSFAKLTFGSSETVGEAEAFAGIKDGSTFGMGASATAVSLSTSLKATYLGYGVGVTASYDIGTTGLSVEANMKMFKVKAGLGEGGSIKLEALSPKDQ
jgi:RHS repeat-associated protein